ncbi:MAG: hypothetical protein NTU94_03300 [Planctomycetota bacterium]|nr:hypothetical protein [Planctomycetota bacterium]
MHSDPKIEPAQRSAVAWIILSADNKTGCAWASYKQIHKNTGLARATIREALRRAEGKYLQRAGLGRKGTIHWRVAVQPLNRSSAIEPQPAVQPLTPAVQPLAASGSTVEPILTLYSSASSSPSKTRRGKSAAPPDPRVKTFIDWFTLTYQTVLGINYVVVGGKDGALVKGLLRNLDSDGRDPLVDLQAAAEAMLADKWGREHASIGVLSSQINEWRKKAPKPVGDKYAHGF